MPTQNNTFDWNAAFTGIALLLAIASPIITSIINSFTTRREREASFYLQHQTEVIERYVQRAGIAIWGKEGLSEYGKSYGEMILYCHDDDLISQIVDLNAIIKDLFAYEGPDRKNEAMLLFNDICFKLSKNPPRVKVKKRKHITK